MAKETWGESWTEQKLDAFEKYVNAYLTIMNQYRDKFSWKLIYFDAFAGSGKRKTTQNHKQAIPLFDITEDEEVLYQGAAERVLRIQQRGFDLYYFIENDEVSRKDLENRLAPISTDKKLILEYRVGDANEYLNKLADHMKKNKEYCSLTLLDPFGMQVNWDAIKQLKDTRTDLWILIPSGVIVNRLLDRSGKLTHIEKLVSFFGLPEQEIKDYFYKPVSRGLFDIEGETQKVSGPIQKISELYIQRLKTIFKEVTPKPLEMINSRNVPIYHFAFASNNAIAKKIASQIIGKETK
jgi:three-Cys-motif partner protein